MEKRTKRTFRWGTIIPMALTAFSCIFLFIQPVMPLMAFAATAGALLLVSGLVCAVAFFFGQPIHVVRMLSGVVLVSVGMWALISCTNFSRSVFALGLGIYLFMFAVAEVFGAVEIRSSRAAAVVRFVLAAGYAATGVLLVVNNFVSVFPAVNAALTTAGAIILFTCLEELFLLKKSGFFAEETLVYRPVRKKGKEETDKGEK